MSVALLDVNVLVALFDPAHPNHDAAHAWFGPQRRRGWATCPLTVNGCIRVLSNPDYPSFLATPGEVIESLRQLCGIAGHVHWDDSVSLLDSDLFRPALIPGRQSLTDVYLLGLAVRHHGLLATFDRSIAWKAVVGATPQDLLQPGARTAV
jgi:toxin-antitoxin system PIN domain toxin